MSIDTKFNEARISLGHSQALLDSMSGQNVAPQQPQEAPPDAQNALQTQEQPQQPQDLAATIKEVVGPMFDDLKKELQKEEAKEQAVELKIEGQMSPAETSQ